MGDMTVKKKYLLIGIAKKALATVLCVLCACSAVACGDVSQQLGIATTPQNAQTDAQTDGEGNTIPVGAYGGLFDYGKVINIDITMANTDKVSMFASPETEEYYHADATVDGQSIKNVGFRTRGNVSYVSTTEKGRFSFKLHFGKFAEGGTLNGLDELCLNNMAYDPSYIREYLMYMALNEIGAPAPLATFANVTVNGEYAGLYLAVEAIDDSFLQRIYSNSDGNLYKAGRDSTMVSTPTTFELKNGDDSSLSELKRMVSSLSDLEKLPTYLDISSVLKYTAVNAVITNEDSYLGQKARNFYFYSQNGKLTMIPWDFNLAFGTDTSQRKDSYAIKSELVNFDVKSPYFGVSANERPLVSNLLSNEAYYNEYIGYVKQLVQFLEKLPEKCNGLKAYISESVSKDTKAFYSYDMFENEFNADGENSLMGFIKARTRALKNQLAQ